MAAAYATAKEVEAYLGFEDVTEKEVEKAELDIDLLGLGKHSTFDEETGRVLNVSDLKNREKEYLARAVAEQVKYRRKMGDDFFDTPERKSVSGSGISYEGALPKLDPRAKAWLSKAGLIKKVGRVKSYPAWADSEDFGWIDLY